MRCFDGPRRHIRIPVLGKAAPPIGSDFVSLEAASGIVLLLGAAAALVWVNTDTAGYTSFWHHAAHHRTRRARASPSRWCTGSTTR